uniref:Kinase suppressor of ras 1 n=1 Tax=Anolis carolinensis TaxID=28377 RepID=A0A803SM17_ANOCA
SSKGLRVDCSICIHRKTFSVKLVRYIGIQLQCKLSVPPSDRSAELNSYPRFSDWLYLVNLRKDVVQVSLLIGFILRLVLSSIILYYIIILLYVYTVYHIVCVCVCVCMCVCMCVCVCVYIYIYIISIAYTYTKHTPFSNNIFPSIFLLLLYVFVSMSFRFSTKSWLSQVCQVCQKSMMFGVKCKHCRLKCHNKCTKEAPPCRISFLPIPRLRRTESVPSDINNPVDRPSEPQFGTLPKALTKKEHPPAINHLDSSSNPSSTTSSTPSSPAPFQSSNPPSATPPPNQSPMGQRDNRFNFPAAYYIQHRQQFIFPGECKLRCLHLGHWCPFPSQHAEDQEPNKSEAEDDEDEIDDLPSRRSRWRGMIGRKGSQTSVYLQEWDIPFEQIELGDPIGQGRWGKVYRGRWHGEVAIRLLEIDGNNQDHLKLFKKEVMNYRQTRHENVVLFMGACMNPPHLAIITSFCKGRTLHSFVRDPKISLDINKTRQIAQEIIKGMGYLHAKGIVHKDLKSKNIFYENGKVVITDFGLFGISGVVQEGRRENELKLPHDWLCYLAPEIVREMAPGKDEDKLPFSKAADVYAFGERPSFTLLMDMLEKLPKLNRRLSHPGHFWKSADPKISRYIKNIDYKNALDNPERWISETLLYQ